MPSVFYHRLNVFHTLFVITCLTGLLPACGSSKTESPAPPTERLPHLYSASLPNETNSRRTRISSLHRQRPTPTWLAFTRRSVVSKSPSKRKVWP
jgi:hypothetical protein